jgi:hypothetical protein
VKGTPEFHDCNCGSLQAKNSSFIKWTATNRMEYLSQTMFYGIPGLQEQESIGKCLPLLPHFWDSKSAWFYVNESLFL